MFIDNGKLFSQTDGVAMGNRLGPTLGNCFLGMIEKEIFNHNLSFYSIILCALCERNLRYLQFVSGCSVVLKVLNN